MHWLFLMSPTPGAILACVWTTQHSNGSDYSSCSLGKWQLMMPSILMPTCQSPRLTFAGHSSFQNPSETEILLLHKNKRDKTGEKKNKLRTFTLYNLSTLSLRNNPPNGFCGILGDGIKQLWAPDNYFSHTCILFHLDTCKCFGEIKKIGDKTQLIAVVPNKFTTPDENWGSKCNWFSFENDLELSRCG